MTITPSSMLPLKTVAPQFNLLDVTTDKMVTLDALKSNKGTVIAFICNHCPFVKHIRAEFIKIANEYQKRGITFIAINSNDAAHYVEDSPQRMKEVAAELHMPFPYLYDETQEVAKAYHAACTPDFFVFDGNLECVYRGQMDDSRPGNQAPINGADLCNALDCLLNGQHISEDQKPSVGCNIKWKQ